MKITYLLFFFLSFQIFSEENIVIVISMDGVRYDYPDYMEEGGFAYMEKKGSKAFSLIPVYQSSTFPTHVSMATGVTPDKHGILHNSFFDKQRGSFSYGADASWIESEPVWSIVEKNNIKTATYFWVGSETDWRGNEISYSKAPFNVRVSEKEKISQILEWLDLDTKLRPRLIMTWWHGSDSVAHKAGALNNSVLRQLRSQDKELLYLIEEINKRKLWNQLTLIVVSDHGMSNVSNYINIKELLKTNSIDARLSVGPAVAHIFLKDLNQINFVQAILLKEPNLSVWTKDNLPSELNLLHNQRTGDLVVTTKAPNMLVNRNSSNPPKGMHGYNPDINEEMEGIFFAMGNKVSNRKTEKVHQLDIAPTVLDLLNLKVPEHMTGSIIDLN